MTYSPEAQDPSMSATAPDAPTAPAAGPVPPPMTPHAAGVAAAFFQGGVFGQFYVLFFINLAFLLGAILPWHGGVPVFGFFSLPGAVILYASIGSLLASIGSIYTRHLLFWPTLLTWLVADFFVVLKLLPFFRDHGDVVSRIFSAEFKAGLVDLGQFFGIGFAFVFFAAIFLLLFLFVSVFIGARTQAKKKEAQKQARAASRGKSGGSRGKNDRGASDDAGKGEKGSA
jgi:hypothetical protein